MLDPPATPDRQAALALDVGHGRSAALHVPGGLSGATMERLRERVAPALEALLAAALDRDRLQAEVVETHALRRSDVIKTALLRAVSHDLRTPLTAITGGRRGGALGVDRAARARRARHARRGGGAAALRV